MNDDDAPLRTSWLRGLGRGVGYMVLAVGLYVLSSGPVIYLFDLRSQRMDHMLDIVYKPLIMLDQRTQTLGLLSNYCAWWEDLPGGPRERMRQQGTPLPAALDPGAGEPSP